MYFFLKIFLTAFISTIGAFVPILILMYIHFCVRKKYYKKKKEYLNKLRSMNDEIANISQKTIDYIYELMDVKNFEEFAKHPKNSTGLTNYVNELYKQKTHNTEEATHLILDIEYIKDYSFMTYISNLLDKRFPDSQAEH